MIKPAIWVSDKAGPTQTSLYSHRSRLEARNFRFKKMMHCTICVAKTKALISLAPLFSHMQIVDFRMLWLK